MKFLILNGPNLNLLGVREPDHYGTVTYVELCRKISEHCKKYDVPAVFYQSNHEGDLIDRIQSAFDSKIDGIIFNPGAFTHTSIALADALRAVRIPTVEVHISKVEEREDFRQVSFVRPECIQTITGHGINGYLEAADFLLAHLNATKDSLK